MRVGIVTVSLDWVLSSNNYGSLFQVYALNRVLNDLGVESGWIKVKENKRSNRVKTAFALFKTCCSNFKKFSLKRALVFIPRSKFSKEFNKTHPRFFQNFIKANIKTIELPISDLLKHEGFSCFVAGSDQIWISDNPFNFLAFAPPDKRVSYAASCPWGNRSETWKNTATRYLKDFKAVSVREDKGTELLMELGVTASQVLDPTLLLSKEDYLPILMRRENGKPLAVFAYVVNISSIKEFPFVEMVEAAATLGGEVEIAASQNCEYFFKTENISALSPGEWLGRFVVAESIVTTSYHGVIFAIIFERPFLLVLPSVHKSAEYVRFYSLLKLLNLSDRIYDSRTDMLKQMQRPIDWASVRVKVDAERIKSICFIKKSLDIV